MSTSSDTARDFVDRAQPETLRGRRLGASLTVNDLAKSLAWYRDIAGFVVEKEHERDGELRAVTLRAGAVTILIAQDDGAKGWDRIKGQGMNLQITTAQDIDTLAARARQAGGALETEPTDMPWGARVFRLRDPDGFLLTISTDPSDSDD